MLSNSQVFHLKDNMYFHPDSGWNTSVVGFSLTLQRFSFKYICLYFLPTGDGTEWQVWLRINFLFQGCLFWFPLWASWFHRQPTLPAVDCSSQLSWWISKHVVLPPFLEPLKLKHYVDSSIKINSQVLVTMFTTVLSNTPTEPTGMKKTFAFLYILQQKYLNL